MEASVVDLKKSPDERKALLARAVSREVMEGARLESHLAPRHPRSPTP
jgi:hypothetical protein